MKRVIGFLKWVGFMLLILPVVISKVEGQQRPAAKHVAHPLNDRCCAVLPVTEYSQPFIYSLWWAQIADCEGAPVPDSALQATVQFFSVPASLFTLDDRENVALATTADWEPSIYMGAPYVWEEAIVKHEMLHMLLYWAGYRLGNYHPPELFERPDCGIHILGNPHS